MHNSRKPERQKIKQLKNNLNRNFSFLQKNICRSHLSDSYLQAHRKAIQSHCGLLWDMPPHSVTAGDVMKKLPHAVLAIEVLRKAESQIFSGFNMEHCEMESITNALKRELGETI